MKKEKKQKLWKEETDKLMEFLYENELESKFKQFSPYHIRILDKIDVWSGSKKYYVRGSSGSRSYNDIQELKEIIQLNG